MKPRLTLFLSGVSHEFASFRDVVENEIQKKGCFAENQSSFAPDYRTVEEMLRRKLHDADAVIHIVGFRFGAEPNERPVEKPRRSYTQMEFDIAREMQKPVYVFLSADATVRDSAKSEEKAENGEVAALQLAHRQGVQDGNQLYYFFKDSADLRQQVAAIPMVAHASEFKADIGRIDKYAPAELIGRETETKLLDDAWLKVRRVESPRHHVLTFVAFGGEGKTSLVAKWTADLAAQDWPGCDAVFAWSFYSQGTREQVAASSDLFLKEALTFFGDDADKEFAASNAGAFEKGQRLARIVGQRRSLLILDGLEPLQYAPTSPTPGQLKDQGIAALLKGLAAASHGLCVVTTRYSLPELRAFWQTTAPEVQLLRLSRTAGVHLLQSCGVKGSLLRNLPFHREQVNEFEKLVEDVQGHALTLNLLGTYLRDAHAGDIRKRDLVKLEEADAEEQGGRAFRVMEAYERKFERDGEKGRRALAVLRLLGLFDRPVTSDCLGALLQAPAIPELTDPLVDLTEAQRNLALKGLENARLLTVNRDASGALLSLDAHPLLREYFARELRAQQPDARRAAHRRIYEHLCASTPNKERPSLEDLQPLYQAVAHGCQAGLQQETWDHVFFSRILRGHEFYSTDILGVVGSDLGAIASFFENPWSLLLPNLKPRCQCWLLNEAGFDLHALGRPSEALKVLQIALEMCVQTQDWLLSCRVADNLTQLQLTNGDIGSAQRSAERSVTYADHSRRSEAAHQSSSDYEPQAPAREAERWRIISRARHADAMHHAGLRPEAQARFHEAEAMQMERDPARPLLDSMRGFPYCDLLVAEAERAAWRQVQILEAMKHAPGLVNLCRDVMQRAAQTLGWVAGEKWLLGIALAHLALGRAALYRCILEDSDSRFFPVSDFSHIDAAADGLRRAGAQDHVPRALLTRAWLRFLTGARTGPDSAQADLDEAWEIAERGPMRLHMADIHLYRARLFFREAQYPWESPSADLAAAEKLINDCGYHRRDEELADAKAAIS